MINWHFPNLKCLRPVTPLASIAIAMSIPMTTNADVLDWICPDGGIFSDPNCWSTGVVPSGADTARFNLPGNYQLLDDISHSIDILELTQGSVGITLDNDSSFLEIKTSIVIGNSSLSEENTLSLNGNIATKLISFSSLSSANSSTLNFGLTTQLQFENLIMSKSSAMQFNLGVETPPVIADFNGTYNQFLSGTLSVTSGSTSSIPVVGSTFDLIDLGGYQLVTPFDSVVTEPPPGIEFIISGNTAGSSKVSAEVVTASSLLSSDIEIQLNLPANAVVFETADMNGSGVDDVATIIPGASSSSGKLLIFTNDGVGNFTDVFTFTVGPNPVDIAIADFDGDTTNDVMVLNQTTSTVSLFINPGNDPASITLQSETTIDSDSTAVVACNLGTCDFSGTTFSNVVGSRRGIMVVSRGTRKAKAYRTKADGLLQVGIVEIEDDPGPADSTSDETKGDDDTDIGIGHSGRESEGFNAQGITPPSLTLIRTISNDCDCEFLVPNGCLELVYNVPLDSDPVSITSGDLNGDFVQEIIVGQADGNISLLDKDGLLLSRLPVADSIISVSSEDLDGISGDDLIASVTRGGDSEILFLGNSGLSSSEYAFQSSIAYSAEKRAGPITSGDLYYTGPGITGGTASRGSDSPQIYLGILKTIVPAGCSNADVNNDGSIDGGDLGLLIAHFGICEECPEDLNNDNLVNGADMGILLSYWGPCIP